MKNSHIALLRWSHFKHCCVVFLPQMSMNVQTQPSALMGCVSTSLEATTVTARQTLSSTPLGWAVWVRINTFSWYMLIIEHILKPRQRHACVPEPCVCERRHSLWKLLPRCSFPRRRIRELGLLQWDRSWCFQSVLLLFPGPGLGKSMWIMPLCQLKWVSPVVSFYTLCHFAFLFLWKGLLKAGWYTSWSIADGYSKSMESAHCKFSAMFTVYWCFSFVCSPFGNSLWVCCNRLANATTADTHCSLRYLTPTCTSTTSSTI